MYLSWQLDKMLFEYYAQPNEKFFLFSTKYLLICEFFASLLLKKSSRSFNRY